MNANVVRAIFKRNFLAYFNNPTGYVFICLFVGLGALAAFWPNEFFNANLDNLDQLNKFLPYVLLIFIPAITMSIWAEERRQGTDELLLTIPATDFDVVVGKYLAAVAIYSVALAFSLFCNLVVLFWLGQPDIGLFLATYIGYWIVGLAMLATGMVASFLTGNLTVGFVLGVLFNSPLVMAGLADMIVQPDVAVQVKNWSVSEQFRDFGRGVISLPSVVYFGAIVAVMLYLSIVLISRRHWQGRVDGGGMGGHYLVRTVALVVLGAGAVMLAERTGARADISSEQLSSLSPNTRALVRELKPKHMVQINAYISSQVPESYVQTRLNLLSALREFKAFGGNKLNVQIHDTAPLSEEADRAEKLYGITARQVASQSQGALKLDDLYLGVAFQSGLNKVVIPFFDYGTPVEYELARSVATVAQQGRKKVGVLTTDAPMFGGFDPATMTPSQSQAIITELEKQYDVKQVSADQPIAEKFDVLLAVQPSSLGPDQMEHFVNAVENGQATAIFEDPFPFFTPNVPGTAAPKQPPQQMMMMGRQPPQPKGNIGRLWSLLGVDFSANSVVWQRYNPYPKLPYHKYEEFIFVDPGASSGHNSKPVFNPDDQVSSGLQQLLLLFPGFIKHLNASGLSFKPLVMTGEDTGYVRCSEILQQSMFGGRGGLNPNRHHVPTRDQFILAAHIQGTLKNDVLPMSDKEPAAETPAAAAPAKKAEEKKINVVLVADIDLLNSEFFEVRSQANDPARADMAMHLDNITFVLNALDELAGDERFIPIRNRRPTHRTLITIDKVTEQARKDALENREKFIREFEQAKGSVEKDFADQLEAVEKRKNADPMSVIREVEIVRSRNEKRLQATVDKLQKDRDRKTNEIERELALQIRAVQNRYKMWAVFLPPIPPLLVGLAVFFNRRAGEREGVSRSRLR